MCTIFTVSVKSENYKKTTPQKFFDFIKGNGVKRIIDIRKGADSMFCSCLFQTDVLAWACKQMDVGYVMAWDLSPQKELYQRCNKEVWDMVKYAHTYFADENIVKAIKNFRFEDKDCFMCNENELYNCHRWLIVEALKAMHDEINIVHLGLMKNEDGTEQGAIPTNIETEARAYIRSIFG